MTYEHYRREADRTLRHLSAEERDKWARHCAKHHVKHKHRRHMKYKRMLLAAGVVVALLLIYRSLYGQTVTPPPSSGSSASLPSGMIAFVDTGSCPTGFTEVAKSGNYLLLTVAANADAGANGGSNSYTPAGSVAAPTFTGNAATLTGTVAQPTFTGNAATLTGTVAQPTFTGTPFSSVINHTHVITMTWNVQGGTTASTTGTHVMTSAATGGSARAPTSGDVVSASEANPSGGVASITPAGTVSQPALTMNSYTPGGTVSQPGLTMNSYTPGGSNSAPAFTGNSATLQPTYYKVIPCKKT